MSRKRREIKKKEKLTLKVVPDLERVHVHEVDGALLRPESEDLAARALQSPPFIRFEPSTVRA